MNESSAGKEKVRRAHPLAISLIARLHATPRARILEVGSGSGRNTEALEAAGFYVDAIADGAQIPDKQSAYDGTLATHALLHGTPPTIAASLEAIARSLKPGAPFHATFGSTRDARFGKGVRMSKHVYAADSGDEAGVPHVYFSKPEIEQLLQPHFTIESVQETAADEIVGRWAHSEPLRGVMHWFVRATVRNPTPPNS